MRKQNKNALIFFGVCFVIGTIAVTIASYLLLTEYLLLTRYRTVDAEVINVDRKLPVGQSDVRCMDEQGTYNYFVEVQYTDHSKVDVVNNITNRGGGNICDLYQVGDEVQLYYHEWNNALLLDEEPNFSFTHFLPGLLIGIVGTPFLLLGLIFPLGLYAEIRDRIKKSI